MKFKNALKYIESAKDLPEYDNRERMKKLCEALGKVNTGAKYIYVTQGEAGFCTSTLISNILSEAGYRCAVITSEDTYEPYDHILLDGNPICHEDFSVYAQEVQRVASELCKSGTVSDGFTQNELIFAIGLLAACAKKCEYVILVGNDQKNHPSGACQPIDICVLPDSGEDPELIENLSEMILSGPREMICSAASEDIHSAITDFCADKGCRMTVLTLSRINVISESKTRFDFSYYDKQYSLNNPSEIMKISVMSAIETVIALRRSGISVAGGAIERVLNKKRVPLCCELVSMMPDIYFDRAADMREVTQLSENFKNTGKLKVIFDGSFISSDKLEKLFPDAELIRANTQDGLNPREAAKLITGCTGDMTVLCFGKTVFVSEVKYRTLRLMIGL